jgi:hypothetical protein
MAILRHLNGFELYYTTNPPQLQPPLTPIFSILFKIQALAKPHKNIVVSNKLVTNVKNVYIQKIGSI